MEKKVSHGIYAGTVVGAGLMAILAAVVGPFMILSLTLLSYSNNQSSPLSALILGIVIGAIVGAVLGTVTGMIGAAVLINLAMGHQANRAGTSRSVVLQQWEVKQVVVLGAIGGGIGITILIQYLRHSGSINRADLSDTGEDLVNKNRLRHWRK